MASLDYTINLSTKKFVFICILTTIIVNISWNIIINTVKRSDFCQYKWILQNIKTNYFDCNIEKGILPKNIKQNLRQITDDFPFMDTQIMEINRYSEYRGLLKKIKKIFFF